MRQVGGRRLLVGVAPEGLGDGELRERRLAELELDLGPLRDPQRVVAGLRATRAKRWRISCGALQVVLLALELEALRVVDRGAGLHAQQGVVGDGVLALAVVAVVGGHERGADGLGDLDEARVRPPLRLEAVVLQLDEEVLLAEDVLQAAGESSSAPSKSSASRAWSTTPPRQPGRRDEPVVVAFEQLPVDAGLVVVALQVGGGRELDEVAVALGRLGQQRQVVVELLAPLALAAGVVDAAPPDRALVARLRRHVGLGADDRA